MTARQLLETLDDFASRNIRADFWLRDDDATLPGLALDRLLGLAEEFSIPITLAVIPKPTGDALANRLEQTNAIDVAAHGWSHENYAGQQEKKRELGLHRPLEVVIKELEQGLEKLHRLHGDRFVPMLVPPWNRIDEAIIEALPDVGYKALSVYGPEKIGAIPLFNTHIDVIDWRGTRGGKDHDLLFSETVARLKRAHDSGGMTGILTHHLDHDERVWSFLRSLFEITASHPGCRWRSSRQRMDNLSP